MIAVEEIAHRRNLNVQIGFLDYPPWSDGLHDGVFRDQLALLIDEEGEQLERARSQRDRAGHSTLVEPIQTAGPVIEPESLQQYGICRTEPVHPPVPRQGRYKPLRGSCLPNPPAKGEPLEGSILNSFGNDFEKISISLIAGAFAEQLNTIIADGDSAAASQKGRYAGVPALRPNR